MLVFEINYITYSGSGDLLSELPLVQQKSISVVQEWLLWLLEDEMISLACENNYMTHPFLLTIGDHVTQGHVSFHHSCSLTELPLKFVFGPDRCRVRFIMVRSQCEVL